MNSTYCSRMHVHPMGESATHGMARAAGRLALLLVIARIDLASSSRLAMRPAARTLPRVQLPELG